MMGPRVLRDIFSILLAVYLVPATIRKYFFPEKVQDISTYQDLLKQGSSVHCNGKDHSSRKCYFKNLCYDAEFKTFLFLHGPKSVIVGFDIKDRFNPALAELSSVTNHSAQFFNYVDIPVSALNHKKFGNISFTYTKILIFNRFHPDNLMHVFHDDLIPVYNSLLQECEGDLTLCSGSITLFLNEGRPPGQFYFLYEHMLETKPILVNSLSHDVIHCFSKAIVGISKTPWYHYGFKIPQGPIPTENWITGDELTSFTQFYKEKLETCDHCKENSVLIIIRKRNRKLLNVPEVVAALEEITKLSVRVVSLEDDGLVDVIRFVACSSMLVSLHGSTLILSVFLKPGSVILELFPYGLDSENYTPYKTLASLENINLIYASWENKRASNAIAHPEYPRHHGGLMHLPLEERRRIQGSSRVEPHLCCDNPDWLYRIYQDTIVDISSFSRVANTAWTRKLVLRTENNDSNLHLVPSRVNDIACEFKKFSESLETVNCLMISWNAPWNLEYFPRDVDVSYELWVLKSGSDKIDAYFIKSTEYPLCYTDNYESYTVWVRCMYGGIEGPFNDSGKQCRE